MRLRTAPRRRRRGRNPGLLDNAVLDARAIAWLSRRLGRVYVDELRRRLSA